jgi:hypothetical protein
MQGPMSSLDPRLLRVGIEVDGEVRVYDERFDIRVSGTKMASAAQNECEVTISNLKRDVRNYLLTETSPFNPNRTPKRLYVDVGRVSTGLQRIFVGEITQSAPSQPPDIGLTLKALTGAYARGLVIARSGLAQEALSAIAARVAADLEVRLDFQATDKQIGNYAFNGNALAQVNALELAGGVDAYVDDTTLVVKDRDAPLPERVKVLSAASGMVGVPEATERGVKVTFLLDRDTVLGGRLDLESEINPAMTGQYTIYSLGFEAASRETPFYWTAEASRNGYVPPE